MRSLFLQRERINKQWDKLVHSWESTSELWNDNSKIAFEKIYWKEYVSTIRSFFKKLDLIITLIEQSKKEVD